ncbi:hypothetical protein [Schlesneria sp. T3-172]|uniref:hypothetical protein n=1 Tax=Schlesneria sphaerica TaxID=3373610 RepID=UPI0037C84B6F
MSSIATPIFHPAAHSDFSAPLQIEAVDRDQGHEIAGPGDGVPLTPMEVTQAMERLKQPRLEAWKAQRSCGVVTITNVKWEPSGLRSLPPSLTNGLGMGLSAQFAMVYNQSETSRLQRRWAVVTNRGTVLFLSGILPQDRPVNPADFPPCVMANLTYAEAESTADTENRPRLRLARIPRQWTVSLRRADCADDSLATQEGKVK